MQWLKYIGIFMLFVVAAFFGMIWMAPSEVSFRVNEDINAPIDEVFSKVADYQNFKEWINGVQSTKQERGAGAGVGSSYKLFYKGEGQMIMDLKITGFESEKTYAYIGEVEDFMRVNVMMTFEAIDSNLTRISMQNKIEALSSRMKMFMYAEETHKKNASDNLEALKQFIEK